MYYIILEGILFSLSCHILFALTFYASCYFKLCHFSHGNKSSFPLFPLKLHNNLFELQKAFKSRRKLIWHLLPMTILVMLVLFFLIHLFLLKDKCFTEFRCFLSNLNMKSAICIYISPPFRKTLPSPSPSHPSRWIQSPCLSFQSHTANSPWLFYIW